MLRSISRLASSRRSRHRPPSATPSTDARPPRGGDSARSSAAEASASSSLKPIVLRLIGSPRPSTAAPPPQNVWKLLHRSLPFLQPHTRAFIIMIALALAASALGVAEPLVTKYIFDALGTAEPLRMLAFGIGALIALELGRVLLNGRMTILMWNVRLKIDHRLREVVYGKIYALPIGYHRGQRVGGLVNKVNQSLSGFLNTAMELCTSTLPSLVFLILSLITMLNLDWRLSLVVIAFLPLPSLIGAWAAREQAQRERRLIETWSHLYAPAARDPWRHPHGQGIRAGASRDQSVPRRQPGGQYDCLQRRTSGYRNERRPRVLCDTRSHRSYRSGRLLHLTG